MEYVAASRGEQTEPVREQGAGQSSSSRCEASPRSASKAGPLCDPAADRAFSAALRSHLDPAIEIIEVDADINSPTFARPSPGVGAMPSGRRSQAGEPGRPEEVGRNMRKVRVRRSDHPRCPAEPLGPTMRTDHIVPIAETMDKVGYRRVAMVGSQAFTVAGAQS